MLRNVTFSAKLYWAYAQYDMAIAITQPAAGLIGPGIPLFGTISGPTLLDDYLIVTVNNHDGSVALTSGRTDLGGSTEWGLLLGWDPHGTVFGIPSSGSFTTAQAGAPAGEALTVQVVAFHHDGTIIEIYNVTSGTYTYDPVSGIAGLLAKLVAVMGFVANASSGDSTLLGEIRDAVKTTYTTS